MRTLLILVGLSLGSVISPFVGAQASIPWVNGDFELGGTTWTAPTSTTFGDFDGDGDGEAHLLGSGEGTWQISRGATKADVPATASLSFEIEQGTVVYDVRMILLSARDPEPWANNLYSLDPTGTLQPDWFDDHVLSWTNWAGASGHVVLDPVAATAFNVPGWDTMTPQERRAELASYVHMTIVFYGVASGFNGGATLDDFAWIV